MEEFGARIMNIAAYGTIARKVPDGISAPWLNPLWTPRRPSNLSDYQKLANS